MIYFNLADEGEALPGLRQALGEAKAGVAAHGHTPEQTMLRQTREALGLTQTDFAALIQTPVATLRDWEQDRHPPP